MKGTIVKSKAAKTKYYLYKRTTFLSEKCKVIYVGCEDMFDELSESMNAVMLDESIVFILFEEKVELETLINVIENFINESREGEIKLVLDAANIFKKEGTKNCMDTIRSIQDYLNLCQTVKYVHIPPVILPGQLSDMTSFTDLTYLQRRLNEMNIERGINPNFAFSWLMRENAFKRYVFVPSNWSADSTKLSKRGGGKYLKAILSYVNTTFDVTEIQTHDLSCRYEPAKASTSSSKSANASTSAIANTSASANTSESASTKGARHVHFEDQGEQDNSINRGPQQQGHSRGFGRGNRGTRYHRRGYYNHRGGYSNHRGGYTNHRGRGGYPDHRGGYTNHQGDYYHQGGHSRSDFGVARGRVQDNRIYLEMRRINKSLDMINRLANMRGSRGSQHITQRLGSRAINF